MLTLKVTGTVDESHQLNATVPDSIPPGAVEILVIVPGCDEDDAGQQWLRGVAAQWQTELTDPREDLYTLADGDPVDGAR